MLSDEVHLSIVKKIGAPVGPTIRLIHPFLNNSSSSTCSVKRRFDGVAAPELVSLDQVNDAALNPISSASIGCTTSDKVSLLGVKSSKSSV